MFHIPHCNILLLAMLAIAVLFGATMESASAQNQQRCFAETNQCISGRFRQYWEANGGLAVFGFPITPAREERNRDTGQTYLTQWFERNRFELHPENSPPYDVLLGRLGDDRLIQLGRDWRAEPRSTEQRMDCLFFPQTDHRVCDFAAGEGFQTYYMTHGLHDPALSSSARSLALFGLPLTEPRMERNADGDTVLTQWFERARFEWHPNNPREFKVLLGRLGHEVSHGTGPAPTGRVVYVGGRDPNAGDLYIMNADGTGRRRLTTTNAISLDNAELAVSPSGDRVAYRVGADLYVVGLDGGLPELWASSPTDRPGRYGYFEPTWAPDGDYLAYVFQGDLYARRDVHSPPVRITQTADISQPACVSWARNGYLTFRTPARHTYRLWVVRSDGSDRREIAFGLCGTLSPAGDRMVYMNGDLWLVNLDGSNQRQLTSGRNFLPGIWSPDGKRLAAVGYSSENADDRDLYVIDPNNGSMRQITEGLSVDALPGWSPDGEFITFSARHEGRRGVYIIRADGTSQSLIPTPEEASMPRWVSR